MSEIDRITVKADLCGGRPTIRGMRIRVQDILDLLAAGAGRAEILQDYAFLEDGDITAALEYASRQVDHGVDHDFNAFLEALDNPPKNNPGLRELFARKAPWEK